LKEKEGKQIMLNIQNLKVAARLRFLVAGAVLGLVIVSCVSYFTIEKVKMGGQIDSELTFNTDLSSEIVPASLDVERVRYVTLKMMGESPRTIPKISRSSRNERKPMSELMKNGRSDYPRARSKSSFPMRATKPVRNTLA
jgi:hypothetical protein